MNLEKIVDKYFDPKSLSQDFYDYLVSRLYTILHHLVDAKTIPVVTGYLGPVPGSLLSSIGRGYTDLTAALCAVALSARELQIWKEVDGIFTADPRKVPGAKLLASISPDEAAELTYYGSEVIHPFTMEQVICKKIPIRIKNTFHPQGPGTMILPDDDDLLLAPHSFPSTGSDIEPHQPYTPSHRHPTAITIKDNVSILNIHSNRKSVSHGFFKSIFETLDKYGVVVDLISTSEVHISMAVSGMTGSNFSDSEDSWSVMELVVAELRQYGTVSSSFFVQCRDHMISLI